MHSRTYRSIVVDVRVVAVVGYEAPSIRIEAGGGAGGAGVGVVGAGRAGRLGGLAGGRDVVARVGVGA